MTKKIFLRLQQAYAATALSDLRSAPGKWHELKHGRADQIAVHAVEPARMIFEVANIKNSLKPDGGLDWDKITELELIEIEDYHG